MQPVVCLQDYADIMMHLIKLWKIESLTGLTSEAEAAQEWLCKQPPRIRRLAERDLARTNKPPSIPPSAGSSTGKLPWCPRSTEQQLDRENCLPSSWTSAVHTRSSLRQLYLYVLCWGWAILQLYLRAGRSMFVHFQRHVPSDAQIAKSAPTAVVEQCCREPRARGGVSKSNLIDQAPDIMSICTVDKEAFHVPGHSICCPCSLGRAPALVSDIFAAGPACLLAETCLFLCTLLLVRMLNQL